MAARSLRSRPSRSRQGDRAHGREACPDDQQDRVEGAAQPEVGLAASRHTRSRARHRASRHPRPEATHMFDIGWSEILVIIVVAIVVVGPKDLPRLMGTFGHYAGKLRRAAAEFQRQFDDAMRETEMAEVKKAMEAVRAETASLDQPVMLPKSTRRRAPPAGASDPARARGARRAAVAPRPRRETKPKPPRKRAASTKPKAGSRKRTKTPAEPPHDA